MTTGIGAICFSCQRFRSFLDPDAPPSGNAFCAAFPHGIPDKIIDEAFDHRQPFGGEAVENGELILYLLDPDKQKQLDAFEEIASARPTA